jgi:hypothetical protein
MAASYIAKCWERETVDTLVDKREMIWLCNLLANHLSVTTKHHVLEDPTFSNVVLVTHSLPVAILRTCRLINAEASPFIQEKLSQLPGVRYIVDMSSVINDAEATGAGPFPLFMRCLLAHASSSSLNANFESLAVIFPGITAGERSVAIKELLELCANENSRTSSQVAIRTDPNIPMLRAVTAFRKMDHGMSQLFGYVSRRIYLYQTTHRSSYQAPNSQCCLNSST